MTVGLPQDVREHVKKQFRMKVLIFALSEIAVIVTLLFFGELFFGVLHDIAQYTLYALLIILPVFLTKLPTALLDKDFAGEVVNVNIKTMYSATAEAKPRIYLNNIIELTVKKDDGSTDIIEIKKYPHEARHPNGYRAFSPIRPEHYVDEYKKGNRIYHFKGIKEYLVVDPERDDLAYCAFCGGRESKAETTCKNCGHTLIK